MSELYAKLMLYANVIVSDDNRGNDRMAKNESLGTCNNKLYDVIHRHVAKDFCVKSKNTLYV